MITSLVTLNCQLQKQIYLLRKKSQKLLQKSEVKMIDTPGQVQLNCPRTLTNRSPRSWGMLTQVPWNHFLQSAFLHSMEKSTFVRGFPQSPQLASLLSTSWLIFNKNWNHKSLLNKFLISFKRKINKFTNFNSLSMCDMFVVRISKNCEIGKLHMGLLWPVIALLF